MDGRWTVHIRSDVRVQEINQRGEIVNTYGGNKNDEELDRKEGCGDIRTGCGVGNSQKRTLSNCAGRCTTR